MSVCSPSPGVTGILFGATSYFYGGRLLDIHEVALALRQIEWVGVGCCEAMVPGKEANDGSARAVFSGVRVGSTVVGG